MSRMSPAVAVRATLPALAVMVFCKVRSLPLSAMPLAPVIGAYHSCEPVETTVPPASTTEPASTSTLASGLSVPTAPAKVTLPLPACTVSADGARLVSTLYGSGRELPPMPSGRSFHAPELPVNWIALSPLTP